MIFKYFNHISKKYFERKPCTLYYEYFRISCTKYKSAETLQCSILPALSILLSISSSSLLLSLITFVAKKATTYIDTNPVTE